MSIEIKAVVCYEHNLSEISGSEERYFRIDDKKTLAQVKPDSKYFLVSISAGKIITLTVGKKDKKYSLTTNEYDKDDKWAEAIRRVFSERLVREIQKPEFYAEYNELIVLPMLEAESNV